LNDDNVLDKSAYIGNNTKSLHISVNASLKKLRTDYIDILYLHWWDYTTSIEEVMDGLHVLVQQGKVLYLGISDTPSWIVAQANQYARDNGKTPFVIYQGLWSILARDMERDIVPMCVAQGMIIRLRRRNILLLMKYSY
jgi:aryl-alcohol dehydrogenase-like predicted oxidoreductase